MAPLDQRSKIALGSVVACGVVLAWWQRFVLDDAFISFRYARHLARGQGLVWNPGEPPVEGFTNFLWTVILAGTTRLGLDPELASQALGVACLGGTLVAVHALALRWTGSPVAAGVCAALTAIDPTVSAYATSGLETSAQTLLFTATVALLVDTAAAERWSRGRLLALGALPAVAVTVRPDSAILLAVVLATIAYRARRDPRLPSAAPALAVGAAAVVLVPWLAVRWHTFHALLPNTYLAKVAGDTPALGRGGAYLAGFGLLHAALPFAALALASFHRARDAATAPAFALAAAWALYLAWVGGDFMEFRFVTPIIPVGLALLAWAVEREIAAPASRAAAAGAVAVVALLGWRLTRGEDYFSPALQVETVRALEAHVDHPKEDWRGIGRRLHALFAPESGVTLAVTAAGAIPYASELRTVDMYGLNDRWIAEHAEIHAGHAAGHRRVAGVEALVARGAHLVVCVAGIWTPGEPRKGYSAAEVRRVFLEGGAGEIPKTAQVVEIPLDERRAFRVLYLQPHPAVEARLQDPGWRAFPIR